MGKLIAIVGSQWGDEGKGKVIDYLATRADMVVRSMGGANAGHSVVIDGKRYSLHLIPSGILNPDAVNIIGNGVVFDPAAFFAEIETLKADGVAADNIFVSDRAHLVMPYHKELDMLVEKARGDKSIGTTLKGIGSCYTDKADRVGLRVIDMFEKNFMDMVKRRVSAKNEIFIKLYGEEPLDADKIASEYMDYAEKLAPYVRDTGVMIDEAVKDDRIVLFEGAQGSMLDLDHGTYPYVTSSYPTSGGFTVGSGLGAGRMDEVIGITKAYTTRVGEGPFVTELNDAVGDAIRENGNEYGVTTGRPRRCGWFDGVVVKYSARISGMTGLALMLLDVLSDFDEIKLCYAYDHNGKKIEHFPASLKTLEECRPMYREVPGWKADITGCTSWDELPKEAKDYVQVIEEISGVPVKFISVGPGREQTIVRSDVI